MKVGELYRFEGTGSMRLYGRLAGYRGEACIRFDEGSTIENHQVLMVGEATPRVIDRGVLKWMREVAA